jgi:hypothetical protein
MHQKQMGEVGSRVEKAGRIIDEFIDRHPTTSRICTAVHRRNIRAFCKLKKHGENVEILTVSRSRINRQSQQYYGEANLIQKNKNCIFN